MGENRVVPREPAELPCPTVYRRRPVAIGKCHFPLSNRPEGVFGRRGRGGPAISFDHVPGPRPPLVTRHMVPFMTQSQPIAPAATFALTPLLLGVALHFSLGT